MKSEEVAGGLMITGLLSTALATTVLADGNPIVQYGGLIAGVVFCLLSLVVGVVGAIRKARGDDRSE